MAGNDQILKPQQCSRSDCNGRRIANHLAARSGLNVVHMRDVMKTARRNFRQHTTVLPSPAHLPFQGEANQESRMQKAARVVDGLLDLYAEPKPRQTRAHRRQRNWNGNPTTHTMRLPKSHYLAEINPNQGPPLLKIDVERHHCGHRGDGYNIDDSPPYAACAHGDYSYIYDLYLEAI